MKNENFANDVETRVTLRAVDKKGLETPFQSQNDAWKLEPHVCKDCFGRMASRAHSSGAGTEVLCTNCGACAVVETIDLACCCGIKVRKRNGTGRSGGPLVDAGIRCVENPDRTPAFPSMYVAREVAQKK